MKIFLIHKKNKSKYFLGYLLITLFIFGCGGGGGGNTLSIPLVFTVSGLPSSIESYDAITLNINPSFEGCVFNVERDNLLWFNQIDDLTFSFRAPIIFTQNQTISFKISAVNNSSNSGCSGSQTLNLNVTRKPTQFVPIPDPNNIPFLSSQYFSAHDLGFGGIEMTERYSATVCYPTANDCTSYVDALFGNDAHNMATGDFNGDGFEDLVVAWAVFPHTIDQSKKVNGPINIYINDQKGGFKEDLNIYATSTAPTHPFAYRVAVDDLNGDGLDDIFAGSMGLSVDQGEGWGIDPYPHFLLLSNSSGKFEESSANIQDDNNGSGLLCRFAHDASSGDPDGDGDIDLFACNILLINDGIGNFTIHQYLNLNWYNEFLNPMASLLVDLNNDGFDDVLFWNFNDRRNFSSVPEEGFILLSNGTNEISNWNKISLPPGPFGINQTKYNHAAKGDLNNDGYLDVVVGVTRADPYYEGAYIQVLINNGSGKLIDETASRFNNQVRATSHHGEGNIYLRDMNLDGILDIVHSTRDFQSNYHGAHIAINDGSGNFQSLPNSALPNRPDRGFNYTNSLYKGLPIDADKQGCLDLISSVDSWQDSTTSRNYLFSILNIDCGY